MPSGAAIAPPGKALRRGKGAKSGEREPQSAAAFCQPGESCVGSRNLCFRVSAAEEVGVRRNKKSGLAAFIPDDCEL